MNTLRLLKRIKELEEKVTKLEEITNIKYMPLGLGCWELIPVDRIISLLLSHLKISVHSTPAADKKFELRTWGN